MGGFAGLGGGKGQPSANLELERRSEELFDLARPILETGASQFEEILRSGGSGALLPSITKAVEGTRSAASSGLAGAEELLTSRGITGTAAGTILANLFQQGELAVAGVEPGFVLPIQQQALNAILGTPQLAISGLGGAAGAQSAVRSTEIGAQAEVLSSLIEGVTGAAGAIGAAKT